MTQITFEVEDNKGRMVTFRLPENVIRGFVEEALKHLYTCGHEDCEFYAKTDNAFSFWKEEDLGALFK